MKRIEPALGDVPLIKLTTPMLDEFYGALVDNEGLSPASVRQVHSIVRRGLKQGVKWGWIQRSSPGLWSRGGHNRSVAGRKSLFSHSTIRHRLRGFSPDKRLFLPTIRHRATSARSYST